jgi:hypothetical protein
MGQLCCLKTTSALHFDALKGSPWPVAFISRAHNNPSLLGAKRTSAKSVYGDPPEASSRLVI